MFQSLLVIFYKKIKKLRTSGRSVRPPPLRSCPKFFFEENEGKEEGDRKGLEKEKVEKEKGGEGSSQDMFLTQEEEVGDKKSKEKKRREDKREKE